MHLGIGSCLARLTHLTKDMRNSEQATRNTFSFIVLYSLALSHLEWLLWWNSFYEFSVTPSESSPTSGGLMVSVIWTNLYSSACVKPTLSRTKTCLWRHRLLHSEPSLPLPLFATPWCSLLPPLYATNVTLLTYRKSLSFVIRQV